MIDDCENRFLIFDNPEEKGIDMYIAINEIIDLRIPLTDKAAQQLIDIIQNKLNARI